ncbi:MAG: SIS domain-containing protein [Rhizobiaceae bacterium]
MSFSQMETTTRMRQELEDIPNAISRLFEGSLSDIQAAAADIRSVDPGLITTIARGSSDHAAMYLKYALELSAGIPVASIGPSVSSIYGVSLDMRNTACISISQSGRSPDIVQSAQSATSGGALTIAITNDHTSPLADACAHTIPLQAGPERSVAATKTFVTSIVAGLLLLAHWKEDKQLLDALVALPGIAAKAVNLDWSVLCARMVAENSLLVLGRGPSFAIANEVALKFKETCRIHAEAFSSAEVLHGPIAIVGSNYPVLALISRDASERFVADTADGLARDGADVFATSSKTSRCQQLPYEATGHPLTDPLILVISFYSFIEKLSRLRGLDPDVPRNLRKVTETV